MREATATGGESGVGKHSFPTALQVRPQSRACDSTREGNAPDAAMQPRTPGRHTVLIGGRR